MGKKSGPKPPDPWKTAEAQYHYGTKAREDSLTDAVSAAGTSRYVKGGDGRFTKISKLRPELDDRFNSVAGSLENFDRDAMERTLYDRSTALLRPELENLRESRMTQLNSLGLPVGGDAYTKATDQLDRSEYDTYNRAAMDAVIGAGNESRADRSANMSELAQLLSLAPGSEGNTAQQGADIANLIQGNYAQRSANHNNEMQGYTNAASTALLAYLAFSDDRLKESIQKVGERFGFNWYTWTWNETAETLGLIGQSEGVIAQEVEQIRPDLVVEVNGYKAVNYGGLA